jgi:hypothetical protein
MNRFKAVAPLFLLVLVGCTDTVDTITREYRNATNEALDALMMVTDESSAQRMTNRVFKPLNMRYKDIDDKLKIVEANRSKKEMVKEVLESDGFQVYLNELDMNRQRMSVEVARLRSVAKQYEKEERARLDEEGKFNEEPNLKSVCPALYDLVFGQDLDMVRAQITKPKLLDTMSQFPQWKVETYPMLYEKFMERRKTTFAPPDPPKVID